MTNQIVQNPVSVIGAAKRIWPHGHGSHGWRSAARRTGITLLLLLAWIGVLTVYLALCIIPVLWIGWAMWTLRRRHFVYDARRYGHPIGKG
jgi:hypothetical protein